MPFKKAPFLKGMPNKKKKKEITIIVITTTTTINREKIGAFTILPSPTSSPAGNMEGGQSQSSLP